MFRDTNYYNIIYIKSLIVLLVLPLMDMSIILWIT